MQVRFIPIRFIILSFVLAIFACGGNKARPNMTTEERVAYAMKLFKDKDYFDARTQFRIIILNAPGSTIVDQAQFYLAECHFNMDEFITAAAEYEKVIRLYPAARGSTTPNTRSRFVTIDSRPKPVLTKNTYKAIQEYQRFMEEFPESEYAPEVEKRLFALRSKLAKKEFDTGNLYRKMALYESALYSFDEVLSRFYDSRYAEQALFYKGECLFKLRRWNEAKAALEELTQKFPQSSFRSQAKDMLERINRDATADGTAKN
jgi:outer membrane protein assembly factor BamD